MKLSNFWLRFIAIAILATACSNHDNEPRRVEILFLGHTAKNHDSEKLADILSQAYFNRGINFQYTVDPNDLNSDNLAHYDALLVYANHDSISSSQEKALLDFVNSGGGFIPLHSASYSFRNSDKVVDLIGGQFASHGADSFATVTIIPDHPVMAGLEPFTTWDETYVHTKLSSSIEVLAVRVDGDHQEPYTWVRDYGKGRVFYTAYGHDQRTFNNPGFQELVFNGIRWAIGDRVEALRSEFATASQEYVDAVLPNYERRDPPPKYQLPLPPEASMTLMQVPPGFEVQLFASEPDIAKPITMAWDERGRLWVAESVDYPNTVREYGKGTDRIKILEDTNGDGKADKFTIFADSLNIPTGMVFSNGGLIVAQAPNLLFLKDTNGDDRADIREIIMSGWGTFDTHAGPSNLKYGFDNHIWGVTGYAGFDGTVGDEYHKFAQGIYKFKPNGSTLTFLGATSNNTWGLGFTEENDVFISTANNEHSSFFGIPTKQLQAAGMFTERSFEKIDAHYAIHPVSKNVRQVDVQGGFTAAVGHNFYTARSFPSEYWNRVAFIGEPTGRLIHKHIIEQNGSSFREVGDGWNFFASSDEWVGPVHVETGPDGNVWFLDWYNFIIQHNPTPAGYETGAGNAYEDSLRDKTRGRIYRLVYKGGKPSKTFDLSNPTEASLIEALRSDNMFWRSTAQRLIVERGDKSIIPKLRQIASNTTPDRAGINPQSIHALWTMHGLGAFEGSDSESMRLLAESLKHPSSGVRKATVQMYPRVDAMASLFEDAKLFDDPDLRVRLAAVLALVEVEASDIAGRILYRMTSDSLNLKDQWVAKALQIASNAHWDGFAKAFTSEGGNLEAIDTGDDLGLRDRILVRDRHIAIPLYKFNEISSENAPSVVSKDIVFETSVSLFLNSHTHGVVLAHGNKQNGYSVFFTKDMILHFEVYQNGARHAIRTPKPVETMQFNIMARLDEGGRMLLRVDGQDPVVGRAAGLFTQPIQQGIRVGFDNDTYKPAGNYEVIRLGGGLSNARISFSEAKPMPITTSSSQEVVDQRITIKTVEYQLKFDTELINVKAGSLVEIILENVDEMPHNLLIIKPGTLNTVGAAADEMARDVNAGRLHFVPQIPEVLFATTLLEYGQSYTLRFKVPVQPGDYPFVCTYPGHWRVMNGIMRVVK
jgi:uncharacterized protein